MLYQLSYTPKATGAFTGMCADNQAQGAGRRNGKPAAPGVGTTGQL